MKKQKIDFENASLIKNDDKKRRNKKLLYIIGAAVIIIFIALVVLFFIDKSSKNRYVDWKKYGEELVSIEQNYPDFDKVILKIGNTEVKKIEFYKLKLLNDYTFNGLMKSYEEHMEIYKNMYTEEEIKNMKPHRVSNAEMIDSLIRLEIAYSEALFNEIKINKDVAYDRIHAVYEQYEGIIKLKEENYIDETDSRYIGAAESIEQMNLVASGMGLDIDGYIRYLAEDLMKSIAMTMLEEMWQDEFRKSDYTGTVDDYIEEQYRIIYQKYEVIKYGL